MHFFEKPIRDRIKPKGVLESTKRAGNFDLRVFSILVPVSRNLSPKQGRFLAIFGEFSAVFAIFLRRWDQIDFFGLQKNDQ